MAIATTVHKFRQATQQRIALLHTLRPPKRSPAPRPRITTTLTPRFIHSAGTRPSIPYLAAPVFRHGQGRILGLRPLSYAQRIWLKYEVQLFVYWTVMLWTIVGGLGIIYWWLKQEWLDRLYPMPEDWTWLPKWRWKMAKHEREEIIYGKSMVDWGHVGFGFRGVMLWCEIGSFVSGWEDPLPQTSDWRAYDFPGFDKELVRQQPEAPVQPEILRIGYDITSKPEFWRQCYYEAIMGMAEVAEMTEDHVFDHKRRYLFPRDQMIGPSNPYPKPIFPGSYPAPLEEDCTPCYDSPSIYYVKILTTKGLSHRQRQDAALAYASYLDYKGETTTALELYRWALDSACTTFSETYPAIPITTIINRKTTTFTPDAPLVTPNLLACTTALAQHYARNGDVPKGLGIYLSILRARRSAPVAPLNKQYKNLGPDLSLSSIQSFVNLMGAIWSPPKMPPPPPSGDEPFQRAKVNACDEAALMAHVSEMLFASAEPGTEIAAQRRRDALGWMDEAVEMAEGGHRDERLDKQNKERCDQCLSSGLETWTKMLKVLVAEKERATKAKLGPVKENKIPTTVRLRPGFWAEKKREEEAARKAAEEAAAPGLWESFTGLFSGDWFGASEAKDPLLDENDWKRELEKVDQKRAEFAEMKMMETLNRQIATTSKWFIA